FRRQFGDVMLYFKINIVRIFATAGIALVTLTCAKAQAPKKPQIGWNSERIAFEMSGKEWGSVIEWVSDKTGLPLKSKIPFTGTFKHSGPIDKKYTMREIFDIVNEEMQAKHKYVLIRTKTELKLVAQGAPDLDLIPRVKVADLKDYGRTEFVE